MFFHNVLGYLEPTEAIALCRRDLRSIENVEVNQLHPLIDFLDNTRTSLSCIIFQDVYQVDQRLDEALQRSQEIDRCNIHEVRDLSKEWNRIADLALDMELSTMRITSDIDDIILDVKQDVSRSEDLLDYFNLNIYWQEQSQKCTIIVDSMRTILQKVETAKKDSKDLRDDIAELRDYCEKKTYKCCSLYWIKKNKS